MISGKTIDATGCDIGIYVSPSTGGVTIKGVTVTGASQHAILVQYASNIWIANNLVTNNGAGSRTCPPVGSTPECIPENKPIELVGTSNSVVINNIVANNTEDGGTGVAHDGPQNLDTWKCFRRVLPGHQRKGHREHDRR